MLLDGGSITQYYLVLPSIFYPLAVLPSITSITQWVKTLLDRHNNWWRRKGNQCLANPQAQKYCLKLCYNAHITISMVEGGKVSLKRVTGRPPWSCFGWIEQQGKLQRLGYKWAAAGQGGSMRKWLLGGGQTKAWGRFSSNKAATSWCPPRLLRDSTFFTNGGVLIMMMKPNNSNYDDQDKEF